MCRICTSVTPGEPQITLSSEKSFTYDYVFDTDCDQEEVYNTCVRKLVDGALEGYNATVLAYGQASFYYFSTGSGKTYTMGTGFEVEVQENQVGILPRAIHHVFGGIKERIQIACQNGEPPPEFKVNVQFMELYNDDIIDLLDPTQGYISGVRIKIHEDCNGSIYVKGMTQQPVTSVGEALNLLRQGALSRTTGATQMNSQSSRSHAIFTLLIKQQKLVRIEDKNDVENNGKNEFATLSAKFHFVDLAGSERLKRTLATGERAREGISINGGLLALGNVISALGDKTKKALHVPYRDSKLTRLLQDSLGGNSQTVMIACISPSDSDFMETLNTLNYANRARNIKNKVVINQDKSSKTIAILRQQIQELQIELLEYKQGKRLVSAEGVEVVNDMCHENILLQTEANNLRVRLKAMQETIDTLVKKNTMLLAEKAANSWIQCSTDGNVDVTEIVTGYLKEIQDLQAKLLESEALCQQLRKTTARQQSHFLSPTITLSSEILETDDHILIKPRSACELGRTEKSDNIISRRHHTFHEIPINKKNSLREKNITHNNNNNFCKNNPNVNEAKMDLSKNLEILAKREKKEKNENDEGGLKAEGESDYSDDDNEDSSVESSDSEDNESKYGLELAELTNEISIKQRLIEELERSQQKLHSMKQHYEEKLLQLQERIRATQDERDKVLASFAGQYNQPSEKIKKVKDEYERKVNEMQKEVKRLESAQKQHAKLLKEQNHQSGQLKSLRAEVEDMKRTKVNLMKKMKEEVQKHKEIEMQKTKEIAMLRKESRKRENEIRSLQAENRVKEAVLKRKNEEVSALRSRARGIMSTKAAGRVLKMNNKTFSSKEAKNKWTVIEKNINKIKLNKKAIAMSEKEMERLIAERESLGKELEQLIKKKNSLAFCRNLNPNEVQVLDEQIESAQANMNYLQESISECQHNIMEIEDAKSENEFLTHQLVNTIEESRYLIEKLYSMIVAQTVTNVRSELNLETLNAKIQQLTTDNDTQNQLLQHLISSHHLGIDIDSLKPLANASQSNSENSTPASSRSSSPTFPSNAQSRSFNGGKSSNSAFSFLKHRRYTALPKELLYPIENINKVEDETLRDAQNSQSSLKLIAPKPPESVNVNKKNYSETMSPRLPKRTVNLSNTKLDMESTESPPGSPTAYRRFTSRGENVFSRLTGGTQDVEPSIGRGVISEYSGKTNNKAPFGCVYVASGHSHAVLSVCVTDSLLFTSSKDRSVKVWDLHNGVEVQTMTGHPNNVEVVRYCEINRLLFSASSAYVKIWDLRESPSRCIKTLCSSGLTINGSVSLPSSSRAVTIPQGEQQLNDVALNKNGMILYTASGDRVRVWDLRRFSSTGKLAGGHQAAVMCLAVSKLSETEDVVVTGSKDHYIKVFEVNGSSGGVFPPKMNLNPPHYDGIQSLALQDEILFSGSRDMCIKKWNLTRPKLTQSINNAHSNWICGLVFMPGGQQLISGCRSGILKIWSVETCCLLGELRAHNSPINDVAVNSSHVFTASNSGEVKVWRPHQSLSPMSMSTGKMFQLSM
ncbi:kif21, putative [Pediculus humanus corporis]|uniref:Kif21, putative n=1 Tax=Pediculus humanus subsp. corporis TaxID=121224 RepID=E0VQK1_PEDHC|nr:kif21, putative [Pediculus humanus corporis]EEB15657.1 kif21, putative [Pediculus humanus corporis]